MDAYAIAQQRANNLYDITVTDPWESCTEKGGNFVQPDEANQANARGGIFAGITARANNPTGGLRSAATKTNEVTYKREKIINGVKQEVEVKTQKFDKAVVSTMDRDSWIDLGNRILSLKMGVCTDCAAAAAVSFLAGDQQTGLPVEIMSTGTHAFVVVGRQGGAATVNDPDRWGDDAFVIDIWMQNQSKKGTCPAVAWMTADAPMPNFIKGNSGRLRVEVSLRP